MIKNEGRAKFFELGRGVANIRYDGDSDDVAMPKVVMILDYYFNSQF